VQIAVVTGNPKPTSRTHGVALAVAGALAAALPGATTHPVVDLAGHAPRLFDSSAAELSRLTAAVAAADVAIFASPTYKASYTGMLKAFLDRYGSNGLAGVLAVPVMTGAGPVIRSRSRSTCARFWSSWARPSPPAAYTSPSPSSPTWIPPSPGGRPPRGR
jgi:NAD(P)H-dependent FMN reductase